MKKIVYLLTAICVVLASINIYLLINKNSKSSDDEKQTTEEKETKEKQSQVVDGIDLGLSVIWAECNVGAI